MESNELTIEAEIRTKILVLRLSGDITKDSGTELLNWRNWESGLPAGLTFLLIDFSKVSYINSAGIAALIRLCRLGGTGLYRSGCFGLHYHYEKLFAMVGLNKYLTLYPTEWTALEEARSDSGPDGM